jgi:hypothetical protein
MRTVRTIGALAATLALAGSASAGVLATPTLFKGGTNSQNICVATNIGTAPVTVTVRIVPLLSDPTEETCTLGPDEPGGCQNFANDLAYCVVKVQGSAKNVRAVMMNRDIVAPFTIHTAVEAR